MHTQTSRVVRTVIIGASGYSGTELMRLLSQREDILLARVIAGASAGQRVETLYPVFSGVLDLEFEPLETDHLDDPDVAFVALPSGEAMKIVPHLLQRAARIVDMSGDFRLKSAEVYEQFYSHRHSAPELLAHAVYGLPELNRETIAGARLVANPGCYPTCAILALLPALAADIISPTGIVVNALSGTSGAGRTSSVDLSFSEINENVRAYKLGVHQHIPEIQTVLTMASGKNVSLSFVPHIVPITRGIYTTTHADLKGSFTEQDVVEIYRTHYGTAPFVRIRSQIPQLRDVVRTNYCDIGIAIEQRTRRLIIISVLDNLMKGAAGQAVQNMNIMLGLPEHHGLH